MVFNRLWRFRAFRVFWAFQAFRTLRALEPIRQKFFVVSCVLFVLGFSIMGFFGFPILLEKYQSETNPQCDKEKSCNGYGDSLDLRDNKGNLETMILGGTNFETNGIFAESNRIDYGITYGADHIDHIKSILVLVNTDNKFNFKTLNNMTYDAIAPLINTNVRQIFSNSIPPIPAIPLYHIGGNWYSNHNQTVFSETGDVSFTTIVVDDNSTVHVFGEHGPVFRLQSVADKIQAEQKQQDRTDNRTIFALTWMGVGLVPILIGADFMGRVFLD